MADATGPIVPTSFTLLPKLPLELQRRVLFHALPASPQIVQIWKGCPCQPYLRCWHKAYNERPMGVNLTKANSEARREALREHEIIFGNRLIHPILFNFSQDSLHFRYEEAARNFRAAHDPRIADRDDADGNLRHVIFDIQLGRWHRIHEQLQNFYNLETLTVIEVDVNDGNAATMDGDNGLKDSILRHLRQDWDPNFSLDPPGLDDEGNEQEAPGESVGTPTIKLLTVDEATRLGIAW